MCSFREKHKFNETLEKKKNNNNPPAQRMLIP
jgi:hypothetical protein